MKIFYAALLGIALCCAASCSAQTTAKVYTNKPAENPNKRSADGLKVAKSVFVVTNAQGLLGISNSAKDELVACEYDAVMVLDDDYYALRKAALWSLFYKEKTFLYGEYTNIERIAYKNAQKDVASLFYLTNKDKCNILDERGTLLFEWNYTALRHVKDKKTGAFTHYGIKKDKCFVLDISAQTETACDCKGIL